MFEYINSLVGTNTLYKMILNIGICSHFAKERHASKFDYAQCLIIVMHGFSNVSHLFIFTVSMETFNNGT